MDWLPGVLAAPPAALIIASRLAEQAGWAILGTLKKHAATAQIPVMVYALDPTHDRGELLDLNYFYKPLQPEQLTEQLRRYYGLAGEERTVLVVDDDPAILDLHVRLVRKVNCRPITARNGREALQVLESNHPDLILLDLMMPEMDGFAVLDALRQKDDTRDIPVIILTVRILSDADLERCNRSVTAILSKGLFSAAETLDQIESALAHGASPLIAWAFRSRSLESCWGKSARTTSRRKADGSIPVNTRCRRPIRTAKAHYVRDRTLDQWPSAPSRWRIRHDHPRNGRNPPPLSRRLCATGR